MPRLWTVANWTGVVVSLALVIGRLWLNHESNRGWWGYGAGEWLINYGNGFVRRGLGGEVILRLPAPSDLVAMELWVLGLAAGVAALLALLIQRSMRLSGSAWVLALWLLPTLLVVGPLQSLWQPFWVTSTQFAMRKEQYYLLVVLLGAVWWSMRPPRSARGWLGSASVLGVLLLFGVLIHEGLVLPAGTALLLIGWRCTEATSVGTRIQSAILLLLLPAIGVGAVLLNLGAASDRGPIWQAVDPVTRAWYENSENPQYTPIHEGVPGAISFLGSNPGDGADVTRILFLSSGIWLWWLITTVTMIGTAVTILMLANHSRRMIWGVTVAVAAISASIIPLMLIAYDWGRWIAFCTNLVVVTSLATLVTDPDPRPVSPRAAAVLLLIAVIVIAILVGIQEVGDPRGLVLQMFKPL